MADFFGWWVVVYCGRRSVAKVHRVGGGLVVGQEVGEVEADFYRTTHRRVTVGTCTDGRVGDVGHQLLGTVGAAVVPEYGVGQGPDVQASVGVAGGKRVRRIARIPHRAAVAPINGVIGVAGRGGLVQYRHGKFVLARAAHKAEGGIHNDRIRHLVDGDRFGGGVGAAIFIGDRQGDCEGGLSVTDGIKRVAGVRLGGSAAVSEVPVVGQPVAGRVVGELDGHRGTHVVWREVEIGHGSIVDEHGHLICIAKSGTWGVDVDRIGRGGSGRNFRIFNLADAIVPTPRPVVAAWGFDQGGGTTDGDAFTGANPDVFTRIHFTLG